MKGRLVVFSLVLATLWTAATWLFEGRIQTLLRPEAVTDRIVYLVVANVLVGIVGTAGLLRWGRNIGVLQDPAWPSGSRPRIVASISAGLVLGAGAYVLAPTPSHDPWVLINVFAQVLTVSLAEVWVCWLAVGLAVRAWIPKGWLATASAIVASAILFGLYHFGHSPPFGTWSMVGKLSLVGLLTGMFFFVTRDPWGTVVFHNGLGMIGVGQTLSATGRLDAYEQPRPATLITAALMLAFVAAIDVAVVRPAGAKVAKG